MKNYTHYETGSWAKISEDIFTIPGTNISAKGKCFLKDKADITCAEISMNVFPPGAAMPFSHRHKKNEEIYIGCGGSGQFVIDGEVIEVREGDVLRVATNCERAWRNVSSEDFRFMCIQAVEGSVNTSNIQDGVIVNASIDWEQIDK